MERVLILALVSAGLSACASFDRSHESGYARSEYSPLTRGGEEFYIDRNRSQSQNARRDLGFDRGETLSETEAARVRARMDVAQLEKQLEYDAEKKQYYGFKPYFKNDWDRIEFLKLPNRKARARWASHRGLKTEETEFDSTTQVLIENNDISKGMSRDAVIQSWGSPDFEEHAGNPIYGNERWVYNKQVSTDQGYKQERRLVYFESGRVVGWETLH